MDILRKVKEVTEEVKTSKKALEEALERVEAANQGVSWPDATQTKRGSIL